MGLVNDLFGTQRKKQKRKSRKGRAYDVYDSNGYYLDTAEARSAAHAVRIVVFRRHGKHKSEIVRALRYKARPSKR